jgi:hypothetical protein
MVFKPDPRIISIAECHCQIGPSRTNKGNVFPPPYPAPRSSTLLEQNYGRLNNPPVSRKVGQGGRTKFSDFRHHHWPRLRQSPRSTPGPVPRHSSPTTKCSRLRPPPAPSTITSYFLCQFRQVEALVIRILVVSPTGTHRATVKCMYVIIAVDILMITKLKKITWKVVACNCVSP